MSSSQRYSRFIPFVFGFLVAVSGVMFEGFFRLAYEHNALNKAWVEFAASLLLFIEWPCHAGEYLGLPLGFGDFTNSHFLGSGYWKSLLKYVVVVTLGWGTVFICLKRGLEFVAQRR